MAKNFTDQYKDSRWQKKRLEILERDGWKCVYCEEGEGVTLHVHHAYYEKGKKVWDYDNSLLTTLCDKCHEEMHETVKAVQVWLLGARCLDLLFLREAIQDKRDSLRDIINYSEMVPLSLTAQTNWMIASMAMRGEIQLFDPEKAIGDDDEDGGEADG